MPQIAGISGGWDHSGIPIPVQKAQFSVNAAIAPISAANKADGIEYHRCYTVGSSDRDLADMIGLNGGGALLDQIRAIDSGKGTNSGLPVTFVAVPESESADPETARNENVAAIAGAADLRTGVNAFLSAPKHNALTPRLCSIGGGFDSHPDTSVKNAAVQAFDSVVDVTRGFLYVNGNNTNKTDAVAIREQYGSSRMHIVETGGYVYDSTGQLALEGSAAHILGVQAAIDISKDGVPSHIAGGHEIPGIAKPGRELDFDYGSQSDEGQFLLENDIGFLCRGDTGQDLGPGRGGVMYIGAHTCQTNEVLEKFINVVRMQDWMWLNIARTWKNYLLKENIGAPVGVALAKLGETWLKRQADKKIIYPKPSLRFVPYSGAADDWREGYLELKAWAEPRAPLMRIDFDMYRDDTGIKAEIAALAEFGRSYVI
eukprot:NODE_8_length_3394_cov_3.951570_g7_i0.p1 GENE.NODE_8_length_3394_cov_3.951570_g7_i0~~NODE_8_length_3394_cov_3.951570_g7_i0.p1  ORF type:complete len:429 (-),score=130.24 NODE_8_length_3394_cov_3.951570_g7_i0:1194-2480(-)